MAIQAFLPIEALSARPRFPSMGFLLVRVTLMLESDIPIFNASNLCPEAAGVYLVKLYMRPAG